MTPKFAALLASCVLTASAAAAQTEAVWIEAPSVADVAAAYPAKARAASVGGQVNLTCTLNREGRPHDCAVLGEKPSGYGFGFAARKLAEHLRSGDGGLAGKEVQIPVTFAVDLLKGEAPTVTKPTWATLPSAEDFQATFPKAENGINSVRVVLNCTVQPGGALSDCAVGSEEPTGHGFGQAALALAPKFRVGPWTADGQPTAGARMRLPIRYELQQVAATAKP
jgi:TonB family protein